MFTVTTSDRFIRQARKFFKRHPDLKPRFAATITALQHDPIQPSLGLHQLSGKLAGCHAVSLTYSVNRITLTLLITDKEIILLDIGSHDEVYR